MYSKSNFGKRKDYKIQTGAHLSKKHALDYNTQIFQGHISFFSDSPLKHYVVVARNKNEAICELVGQRIGVEYGNADRDHRVIVENNTHYVVNKPVSNTFLIDQLREYMIPDDSIWHRHLSYLFLGQSGDNQFRGKSADYLFKMLHLDGILMKNFEFDFENGFEDIDRGMKIEGYFESLMYQRNLLLQKINEKLVSFTKDLSIHYELLFIEKLKTLTPMLKSAESQYYGQLYSNAIKLINLYSHHSYWSDFYIVEQEIKSRVKTLQSKFHELNRQEIETIVRYYHLVIGNFNNIETHLCMQILGKSIDPDRLFDEFIKTKGKFDIFPVFTRDDHYIACRTLVSKINDVKLYINRSNVLTIINAVKLLLASLKDELLKGKQDIRNVTISQQNIQDMIIYVDVWGRSNASRFIDLEKFDELYQLQNEMRQRDILLIRQKEREMLEEHIESLKKKDVYDDEMRPTGLQIEDLLGMDVSDVKQLCIDIGVSGKLLKDIIYSLNEINDTSDFLKQIN